MSLERGSAPLTVVLPVRDEGANLARWWASAAPHLPPSTQVLLVYDRDEDDTLPVARALAAEGAPLRLLRNGSQGARGAILTGLRAAAPGPALVMMADLSDDPAAIPPMLAAYRAGADVVVASRYARGGSQRGGPWLKGRLARWASRSLRRLAGFPATDATNNFRLYDAERVREMDLSPEGGFEVGLEITLEAWIAGLRVAEVPTRWRARAAGESRFRLLKWLPRYARLWCRALAHGVGRRQARGSSAARPARGGLGRALQVVACVAAFLGLSYWEMRDESATYDEGAHLSGAYTALVLDDYRLLTEQPPLGRRIGALALLGAPVRIPTDRSSWGRADHFEFGFAFLFQSGNDADDLLGRARWAMLSWGVLLLLSVYAVARELFGHGGGMVALLAATFNPNLLAHAHLVTTDVPVAALMLLAVAAFQRWLDAPTPWRSAAAGILLGGAVATKFSALALGPVFAALWLHRGCWRPAEARVRAWLRRRASAAAPGAPPPACPPELLRGGRGLAGLAGLGGLAAMAVMAWAVVWGAYGFRFATSPDAGYAAVEHLQFGPQGLSRALRWAADRRLLPEAFLLGLRELANHCAHGHWGYALGTYSRSGWWWFQPFAFLVKNPLSFLALLGLGAVAWVRGGRAPGWGAAIGGTFLLVAGLATAIPLAMGIRHLLPAFPFALVACGAAWPEAGRARRWRRWLVRSLAGLLALECLAGSPHHLAWFNAASVAAAPRHRLLGDSNLDWGQDLKLLKRYLDAHGIPKVKLAYFGTASPRQLGLANEVLAPEMSLFPRMEPEWPVARSLDAGDWVAVSAFCLDKVPPELWRPDARLVAAVGGSFFLFRVPEGPRP